MKSWKTTLIGILTGVATLALDMYQTGTFSLRAFLIAAGMAALGIVAKDNNVTGGTVHQ